MCGLGTAVITEEDGGYLSVDFGDDKFALGRRRLYRTEDDGGGIAQPTKKIAR